MKNILHLLFLSTIILSANNVMAQETNPDQNPRYAESRDQHMEGKEEYTSRQGTTVQNTYKAIDYVEDKKEAKAERMSLRRQRAQWRQERRMARIQNRRRGWNQRGRWGRRGWNNTQPGFGNPYWRRF